MLKIIDARYCNGKIILDNNSIPDNSKIIIIWDSDRNTENTVETNLNKLPNGILFSKQNGMFEELKSLPIDAVEFQRSLRDEEWNSYIKH